MRAFLAIFALAFASSCVTSAPEPFPTPDDSTAVAAIRASPGSRQGELLIFRGTLVETYQAGSKPVLVVDVGDEEKVWIAWMYDSQSAQVGDSIRVMGYLVSKQQLGPDATRLAEDAVWVLAFAMVNERTNRVSYLPEQSSRQVEAWASGRVPGSR